MIYKVLSALPTPLMRLYRMLSWLKHHERDPFPFSAVFIETVGNCNRSCQYCAVSSVPKRLGRLSDEAYASIIKQLREINFSRDLAFHFINEPLLDRRIFDFIALARQSLPRANIILVSNGDLIDVEKIIRLFDQCGINKLQISAHDEAAYARIAGLCDGLTPEMREKITTKVMFRREGLNKVKAHSHSGAVKNLGSDYDLQLVPASGCDLRIFTIDYKGKAHACCADGLDDYIIGDVLEEPILAIAAKAKPRIRGHFTGNFSNPACYRCVNGC